MYTLEIADERLVLLPQRALLWPARRMLLLADTHFAKDDVFRRAGLALPSGAGRDDLARLTALVEAYPCERLVVLGDFVHGAAMEGDDFLAEFAEWRKTHASLSISIVAGNHDRHARDQPWAREVEWIKEAAHEPPFVLRHEPQRDERGFVLAGHLHPVVRLPVGPRTLRRVPVFWRRGHCMVLPSFGIFTGGGLIEPDAGDELFAVAPERVIPLKRR